MIQKSALIISYIVVVTLALFVILNIFSLAYLKVVQESSNNILDAQQVNPWLKQHGFDKLRKVYNFKTEKELNEFLNETFVVPLEYDPFCQWKTKTISGKYMNVHPAGFRYVPNSCPPWPPDPKNCNIFVFGGSTTFGAGVADDQTVPFLLQQCLRQNWLSEAINVYNFGVGSYFSSMERAFFVTYS